MFLIHPHLHRAERFSASDIFPCGKVKSSFRWVKYCFRNVKFASQVVVSLRDDSKTTPEFPKEIPGFLLCLEAVKIIVKRTQLGEECLDPLHQLRTEEPLVGRFLPNTGDTAFPVKIGLQGRIVR